MLSHKTENEFINKLDSISQQHAAEEQALRIQEEQLKTQLQEATESLAALTSKHHELGESTH